MKCLGIAIKKNELWYSVVEGTEMNNASVSDSGKHNYRSEIQTHLLMVDFNNIFTELIVKYKPDRIVYKLSLDTDIRQIPYMHYSLGVLNLVCHQNGIQVIERSIRWITANQKSKIATYDKYFDWLKYKNEQRDATLIAWFEIEA